MHRILAEDLFQDDEHGNWVHEFRYRGRTYTMVPGGPATFGDTWLTARVWLSNAPGERDLTLQLNLPVDVLTYRDPLMGSILDEGNYAPIPAEPDAADLAREAKDALEEQITAEVSDYMYDLSVGRPAGRIWH